MAPRDELAPLDFERIRTSLQPEWDVKYLPSVDSTNRLLKESFGPIPPPRTILLTDYQEAGRGRRGRTWSAPPCTSILLSAVLEVPAQSPWGIVMLAALAVSDAVSSTTGLEPEIKWPNDVLVRGRKVAGILVESVGTAGIVGLGINVNFHRDEAEGVPDTATTLMDEAGRRLDREELIIALCRGLKLWYRCLTRAPEAVFRAWKSRVTTVGHEIVVEDARTSWVGVATDVQLDGALCVRDEHGVERLVYAATVSVRDRRALDRL